MRPESVGLVEMGHRDSAAEVTRVGVTAVGGGQSPLRTSPRSAGHARHADQRQRSDIWSTFWSAMASWRFDKSKSAMAAEYLPIAGDADGGEDGVNGDGFRAAQHKHRRQWSWPTYLLGLVVV
jgi:hypothetical protein